jgi:hypothetical protein
MRPLLVTFLCSVAIAGVAVFCLQPPDATLSEPARQWLAELSIKPHPVGSPEHERVKNVIQRELKKLGLLVQIQTSLSAVDLKGTRWIHSAAVENIIARIPGTESKKSILLAAHYDSAPSSRGASDDASGVVILLESARALVNAPRLKNDVIFLFSDAEELGLLGAKSFIEEHPWASRIGLALNFEARGSRGATAMYEMSAGNGNLLADFSKAAPFPVANSFVSTLARLLPNDTDFTIFNRAGIPGFSFAYADGIENYHSYSDSAENIDGRSVQHGVSYALALAHYFGNRDLDHWSSTEHVYFDLGQWFVVHYPVGFAKVGAVALSLLFLIMCFRFPAISLRRVGLGEVRLLVSVIAGALVVFALSWITKANLAVALPYTRRLPIALGFLAVGGSVFLGIFVGTKKRNAEEALLAGVFPWVALALYTGIKVPGVSYMFQWPLLFTLPAAWYYFSTGRRNLVGIMALPAVFFVCGGMYAIVIAIGFLEPVIPLVFFCLLLGLFAPTFWSLPTTHRKWLLGGLFGLGVTAIFGGAFFPLNRIRFPQKSFVALVQDGDSRRAYWVTSPGKSDPWIKNWLKDPVTLAPLAAFYGSDSLKKYSATYYHAEFTAPSLRLTRDQREVTGQLTLTLAPNADRRCVLLWQVAGTPIISQTINSFPVENRFRFSPEIDYRLAHKKSDGNAASAWRLFHCGGGLVPLVLNLQLGTTGKSTLGLRVVDLMNDAELESQLDRQRPPQFIPGDGSGERRVGKTFTF